MADKGTMNNEERLRKTIRFEETDKILFAPGIMQFAAKYAGITQQEFMEDQEKADAAFEKTFVELGASRRGVLDMEETVRIDCGKYAARSYRADGLMAMWLLSAGLLQFYDSDGQMLRTISLWQERLPIPSAA